MTRPRQTVLIMTDTQRKDMLSCYADTGLKTPCLDRLADEGIKFERAYCCEPVCGPARSALFTGVYPHSNGAWGNTMALSNTVKTIGQRLSDQGVHAAYIGKWHLDGSDYFGTGQCPEGWDPEYWYEMRNYLDELSPEDRVRSRNPETNRDGVDPEFTYGHRCTERALDFLSKHADEDFLLVVSYDEPHHPFLCPEPFVSMYEGYEFPKSPAFFDNLTGKPDHQKVWSNGFSAVSREEKEAWRRPDLADFFGCNSFVDAEIGRVLETIDDHCPGALVVYTSDHGDCMGEHSLWSKGPMMYEGVANIPLIIRYPEVVTPGQTSHALVSHIDVVPTVMDVFDVRKPDLLDGHSLMPTLREPGTSVNEELFVEFGRFDIDDDGFSGFQPIRCVVNARYKLVVNLLSTDELYDLEQDPHELTNRIEDPELFDTRNRLHDRLIDWMNRSRDPFRGYYWLNRPWRTDAPEPTFDFTGVSRNRIEDPLYEPRQLAYESGLPVTGPTRKR